VHAQLVEIHFDPERLADFERRFCSELVPALRAEPGFAGALHLADRGHGHARLVLLWETEEEALRSLERLGLHENGTTSVWEVVART
jgi:hypothetical protein